MPETARHRPRSKVIHRNDEPPPYARRRRFQTRAGTAVTLDGTVTVVTGGAGGIGMAVARHIISEGGKVAILDIDGDRARDAAESLGSTGVTTAGIRADVTDPVSLEDGFRTVVDQLGPPYGLVTCAGIRQTSAQVASFPYERWKRVLDVDLLGTFLSCREAAALMLERGRGSIVTIGSTSATLPRIGQAAYCTAKAGVAAFTKVLALELAESGIRANCVNPGSTATGMVDLWSSPIESGVEDRIHGNLQRFRAGVPLRRLARPEEIADSVVFLLSPRSSYITGHVLAVDGGESII